MRSREAALWKSWEDGVMSPVWVMGIFTGIALSTVIDQDPHDFQQRCTLIPPVPLAKFMAGLPARFFAVAGRGIHRRLAVTGGWRS
ncbi:hypothetical protein AB0N81_19360 [Streptomyces sp. NPDC093510]|uniref:hypothetical protein n=1 Tax=Streptomyces sp. NPDC093510 TaxID=3155199 RepID=UPI003430B803